MKTKRGYFRRRSTAGVFAVFAQNPISKVDELYMCEGGAHFEARDELVVMGPSDLLCGIQTHTVSQTLTVQTHVPAIPHGE